MTGSPVCAHLTVVPEANDKPLGCDRLRQADRRRPGHATCVLFDRDFEELVVLDVGPLVGLKRPASTWNCSAWTPRRSANAAARRPSASSSRRRQPNSSHLGLLARALPSRPPETIWKPPVSVRCSPPGRPPNWPAVSSASRRLRAGSAWPVQPTPARRRLAEKRTLPLRRATGRTRVAKGVTRNVQTSVLKPFLGGGVTGPA